jgi:phosphoribosylformylglycinamidine cyclo-ligase
MRPGDVLIALPSAGLHTNGYSLARAVLLERAGLALGDRLEETGGTVGEALLAPHRSYTAAVLPLVDRGLVTGMAHVTGGGLAGNLVRVLPEGVHARIATHSWELPAIFRAIAQRGEVAAEEMRATFNLGVGFVLAARPADADAVVSELSGRGERPWVLGEAIRGARGVGWSE